MKRTLLLLALVLGLVLGLALGLVLGCGGEEIQPSATPRDSSIVGEANSELPSNSIYQLEATLETHTGSLVSLDVHKGHPTLVSMFYANCPMACPTLIGDVKALEAKLPEAEREELRVLLISLDPERDTPKLMTEVTKKLKVDTDRWTLARTDQDQVREIAAVLGIRYRMLEDGEMNHSSIVTLVDEQGVILAQVEGLGQDPEPILTRLKP